MAASSVTSRKARGKVGRKGELFPPKSIRQQAGLKAGDEVIFEAREGTIQVQKVPTLKEAFEHEKFAKVTFKKFEEMTSEVLSSSL
jgi:AbrB family looped-hinge helix DNA binding protein